MRLVRYLIFLPAVIAPLWAIAHHSETQDSILIDGSILDVEAQVQFDSIATDPRNSSAAFQAAWTVNGLVGGGAFSTGWWYWSGRPDISFQCSAELLRFPGRLDRRKRFQGQARLNAGFMVTSLVSVDAAAFPDSLIGFLPASATAPLRLVTFQQFDIGVESDTLDAVTERTSATMPFVSVGWDGVFGEWMGGVAGGVGYRMRASNDRPTLNAPSLNGAAYVPGVQRNPGFDPMIQARIGYRKTRSPWMVQLTALWMPSAAQNHWWGVGVKYDAW
ncbi:MAG: hypothetical protein ACPG08_04245 [Flavobacteriales bacterium]